MDLTLLTAIVGLLIGLSVASERLVEILKGVIPALSQESTDPIKEGFRKAALQALAVIAGIVTAFLARPTFEGIIPPTAMGFWPVLALGLLASGGSGFWNSMLTYVTTLKDLKKMEVEDKKKELVARSGLR